MIFQDWNHTHSKGCFFFEEDGSIVSHQYSLKLDDDSSVWITMEPFSIRPGGKESDTVLYIRPGGKEYYTILYHSGR